MTCIVGYSDKGSIYMGADSLSGSNGWHKRIRVDEKIFIKDDMIFGFTASWRMGQILRYSFKIPEHPNGIDDFDYLCSIWIDALIKCMTDKGYATLKDNRISGGAFLLGYRGKLYHIEGDFQVAANIDSFDSVGCGEFYALGALCILEKKQLSPIKKIEGALAVAARMSGGVSGPFKILKLKSNK